MQNVADQLAPTTIRADLCAIFVSLELSRSTWLGHIAVAGPRGEDVQAQRVRRGYRYAAGALFQSSGVEGVRADRKILPNRRLLQEAGAGWLLDSPCVAESEGIESHVVDAASIATSAPAASGQDGQARWRDAVAGASGLHARRAAGLRNGSVA